ELAPAASRSSSSRSSTPAPATSAGGDYRPSALRRPVRRRDPRYIRPLDRPLGNDMRRLAPLLLLTIAPLCWAGPELPDPSQKRGACVYARPAPTSAERMGDEAPQVRPA